MDPRLPLLTLLLFLSSCGKESPAPTTDGPDPGKPASSGSVAAEPRPALERRDGAGQDAAAMLKRYYSRIEAGDYDAAWAMRDEDAAGRERVIANFRGYEAYRVEVGTPSTPVEARGWDFVEVPVMIYGRYKGGKPFASSGSVSMRRATTAAAAPRQRQWHIYTGD
jgi:hypothetical protein